MLTENTPREKHTCVGKMRVTEKTKNKNIPNHDTQLILGAVCAFVRQL